VGPEQLNNRMVLWRYRRFELKRIISLSKPLSEAQSSAEELEQEQEMGTVQEILFFLGAYAL